MNYQQVLDQHQLIHSIRKELPAGYSVSAWDGQVCISHDARPGDADSRVRQFVANAQEWEALKPTLR